MFKFVADNVGGAGTKRRLSPRSCDACRRRHKRCYHANLPERLNPNAARAELEGNITENKPAEASSRLSFDHVTQHRADNTTANQLHGSVRSPHLGSRSGSTGIDAHVRFVANLSPESAFIINNQAPAGDSSISRHGVGLWLGQDETRAEESTAEESTAVNDQRIIDVSAEVLDGRSGQTLLLSILRPALRRECIATIPPEYELGLLYDLFFAKIDPIFPLLQDEPWESHGVMETVALKQCICLVASLDPTMRPYLKLPHTDTVLSQVEFRARIAAAVKQSLDLKFVTNEIVLLQVCALMAMYVDNEGFGQLSTYYCSQAILHEQTLGFHVGWPDDRAGGERSRRIFWCVYVLDRMNAATNGRPTVIHRHDVDSRVLNSIENQEPAFKLLILITQLLDYTISLYRPQTKAVEHPGKTDTFENLVEAAGAYNLRSGLLASLELFYLSAVILQDRSSENQSSSEHQGFCAARIVAVASSEFKPSLIYWPILPYSVTVASSVAYRSLRKSPMSYHRRRAFTLFHDSCSLLDDLSKAFLSARAIARLAKDTVKEVGRATERTRRDSLRPLGNTVESLDEGILSGSNQPPDDIVQPRFSQGARSPLSPETGTAEFATPYSSAQFLSAYDGNAEIFGNFDPNFDLGRTDAIFSASLDLSVPYVAEDWSSPGNNTIIM